MSLSAAFIAGWVAWVSAVTGLPATYPISVTVAAKTAAGERLYRKDERGFQAMTYADGAVYLHKDFDPKDPFDQCLFAHELVHVMQRAAHKWTACAAEDERLAYAVQEVCMAKRGGDFWQATGWRPTKLARLMECR